LSGRFILVRERRVKQRASNLKQKGVEVMSKYLREVASRVYEDLCGVSVYGGALSINDVKMLAKAYLKITASLEFGWLPPMKSNFKWRCVVCKKKYFLYNNAYYCCLNK
jgi:hypothetical protein